MSKERTVALLGLLGSVLLDVLPDPTSDDRWVCLKRMEMLNDPLRTEFCTRCWRVYMQGYYWDHGLGETRMACTGDNIVWVEEFARLLEEVLEIG